MLAGLLLASIERELERDKAALANSEADVSEWKPSVELAITTIRRAAALGGGLRRRKRILHLTGRLATYRFASVAGSKIKVAESCSIRRGTLDNSQDQIGYTQHQFTRRRDHHHSQDAPGKTVSGIPDAELLFSPPG